MAIWKAVLVFQLETAEYDYGDELLSLVKHQKPSKLA